MKTAKIYDQDTRFFVIFGFEYNGYFEVAHGKSSRFYATEKAAQKAIKNWKESK